MKRSALPLVLGPELSCPLVPGADLGQGCGEGVRVGVVLGVVGQDPLDPDAMTREEGRRIEREAGTGRAPFVVERGDVGDPAHVVDRDMQVVVAGMGARRAMTATPESVPATVGDPAELLDVDVEQLAGSLTDVADGDTGRTILVSQPGQPVAGQDVADGRAWDPDDGRQAMRPEAVLVPSGQDRIHLRLGQGPRRASWPRRSILESHLTLGLVPSEPLPGRLATDPDHVRRVGDGHPVDQDPIHQKLPAEHCQLRPTMCHESLLFDVS